jgi:ribosome biogenesis protein SSF1/2
MVINRGQVETDIKNLIQDVRKVMEPFTAKSLKVTKKNSLKDFISIAGPLHVTHLLIFTQTDLSDHMKIVRLPRGPTIHFKLEEYSLCNDVMAIMKKKITHKKQYMQQPLLILNGFNTALSHQQNPVDGVASNAANNATDIHHKLLATTLQNMFPCINVTKVYNLFYLSFINFLIGFIHFFLFIDKIGRNKKMRFI